MDPDQLQAKYDAIRTEYHICKRKLDSKCEALLILSKELDQCRSERDQFKLMAEQLRERYQDIKRQINGLNPISSSNSLDPRFYSDMQSQSLARLLCETKEQSKSLQFEVDDLRQKLQDALGDIKLLREQIARQRVGTTDEGINTRHFPAYEREDLVRQLESSREQYLQLERDLQQVLDEKEEQVSERDIYRTKYERLNQELNYILRGDEKRIIDIDALSMENKYLKDRLKQMEEEKTIAMATVSKYKSILERKKNKGILKFGPVGQSRSGGVVISQKQVQQLLENQSGRSASPQAQQDLQALASALLDTVNDKNLAISHQRKTNKILGNRVAELEKKIKTLEVSGLWNIPANLTCLEKLRAECEEVKTMLPRQLSETSQTSPESWQKMDSILSPSHSSSTNPSPSHTANQNAAVSQTDKPPISLEDLDLLPTRDESAKNAKFAEVKVGESLEAACCNGYIPDEDRSQKGSGFSQCDHTSTVNQAVQDISVNTSSPECGAGDATLPDNASTAGSNPDPDDSSYRLYNDDGDETFEEMSDLLESLVDTATSKVLQQTEQASHFQREGTLSPTDPTGLAADVVVETRGWSSPTPSQTMSPTCSSPLLGDSGEQSEDSVLNKVDV